VHADDHVLVVDKPSGLLSVPGRYLKDSVLHRVIFDYPDVSVVHRLDLDTSGLLVLARSKHAARDLSGQFRDRQVEKQYVAVVWGELAQDGEIGLPLSADPERRPRHRVDPEHGKEAITAYEVIASGPDASRLRLRPRTGRSHQLRVHLAHIGHPILGCDLYAHDEALHAAPRLLLHASRLGFAHPGSGQPVAFASEPPF